MKVEVLLFAWLREAAGADRLVVDVVEGQTVEQTTATVLASIGSGAAALASVRFAVNEEFVKADRRSSAGLGHDSLGSLVDDSPGELFALRRLKLLASFWDAIEAGDRNRR